MLLIGPRKTKIQTKSLILTKAHWRKGNIAKAARSPNLVSSMSSHLKSNCYHLIGFPEKKRSDKRKTKEDSD